MNAELFAAATADIDRHYPRPWRVEREVERRFDSKTGTEQEPSIWYHIKAANDQMITLVPGGKPQAAALALLITTAVNAPEYGRGEEAE